MNICDICHKEVDSLIQFAANMKMCASCLDKQRIFEQEIKDTAEERINAMNVLTESVRIDNGIQIQTDLFNAHTVAIVKLRDAIQADASVMNKEFTLAQVIETRFNKLKEIIFEKRKEVIDHENEMKAIQIYYNELAKRLRTDERERIRLKDTQYKPIEPVQVKKPRVITVKKYDKDSIREIAKSTGVSESILQMLCVANNMSPVDAARLYKETKSAVSTEKT